MVEEVYREVEEVIRELKKWDPQLDISIRQTLGFWDSASSVASLMNGPISIPGGNPSPILIALTRSTKAGMNYGAIPAWTYMRLAQMQDWPMTRMSLMGHPLNRTFRLASSNTTMGHCRRARKTHA